MWREGGGGRGEDCGAGEGMKGVEERRWWKGVEVEWTAVEWVVITEVKHYR